MHPHPQACNIVRMVYLVPYILHMTNPSLQTNHHTCPQCLYILNPDIYTITLSRLDWPALGIIVGVDGLRNEGDVTLFFLMGPLWRK